LWHYTTWDGVSGIFKDHELRASHVSFLNDAREFVHTIEMFDNIIRDLLQRNHPDADPMAIDGAAGIMHQATLAASGHVFATSFTENGDLLSQWRGYSTPSGFAIGFDPERLVSSIRAHNPNLLVELRGCEYDEEAQRAALSESRSLEQFDYDVFGPYQTFLQNKDKTDEEESFWAGRAQTSAHMHAGPIAAEIADKARWFKDPTFSEEDEWRLGVEPADYSVPREFRARSTLVVPYIVLKMGLSREDRRESPIRAVRVGPCVNPNAIMQAVSMLTNTHRLHVDISKSKVPYRN
jgi:hypothetical protein